MISAELVGEDDLGNKNDHVELAPDEFVIKQNYPNPFNPATNLKFSIADKSMVTLEIFNILGESVMEVLNDELDIGNYDINVDMQGFASGMYFYRLTAINNHGNKLFSNMKKMILMR